MRILTLLAATVAVGAMAVPAAAQSTYPYQSYPVQQAYPYAQPVPQPYPGQPGYGYAQPGYAQPYAANPIEQIVNQLLGNNSNYTVTDRSFVQRCASAAMAQAQRQYRPAYGYNGYGQQRYGQPYANNGYNNGYNNGHSQMRVTAITQVHRSRNRRLQIQGLIDTGARAAPYGYAYGYPGQQRQVDPRYAQADLSFRCNVDYRGGISGLRVSRYNAAYRR
ncbi:MAG TPA: hypothetical protein VHN55_05370 [Sphingomicrobium sp.]|nr:hypothetical protein [Sphingomicrobium sp.]